MDQASASAVVDIIGRNLTVVESPYDATPIATPQDTWVWGGGLMTAAPRAPQSLTLSRRRLGTTPQPW
ncbi:hypothetical protein Agsp01_17660 [Agromyces sp. NBRC 114283]|nr:hypothetical protein GCM10017583_31360 [Agromyces mediolanus]GLU89511.1 hypothetical protein Agsp01_17660 [Agromyces sp. NBRC 114283]